MDNNKQMAFEFVDAHRDEMVSLWREIVTMESGPHEKPGIDAVAARFKQVLDEEGAASRMVEFEKAGSMLIGEFGVKRDLVPGMCNHGNIGRPLCTYCSCF